MHCVGETSQFCGQIVEFDRPKSSNTCVSFCLLQEHLRQFERHELAYS